MMSLHSIHPHTCTSLPGPSDEELVSAAVHIPLENIYQELLTLAQPSPNALLWNITKLSGYI